MRIKNLLIVFLMAFVLCSGKVFALNKNDVPKIVTDYYDMMYKDIEKKPSYKIEYDSSMKRFDFKFSMPDVSKSSFIWLYNEDDNSMEYENDGSINDKNINESYHVTFHLFAISNNLGYNEEHLTELLKKANELNYENDKIEIEMVDIPDNYKTSDGANISGSIIKRIKFNLDGFGGLVPKEDDENLEVPNESENLSNSENPSNNIISVTKKEANPKTSDEKIGYVIMGMIFSTMLIIIGCKKIKSKGNN